MHVVIGVVALASAAFSFYAYAHRQDLAPLKEKARRLDDFCTQERMGLTSKLYSMRNGLLSTVQLVADDIWRDDSIYLHANAATCLGDEVPWIHAQCSSARDHACIVQHLQARRDALVKAGW